MLEKISATNVASEEPVSLLSKSQTKATSADRGLFLWIALGMATIGGIISILQLYMGRRYVDNCPIDWHISNYLVITGAVGIVATVLDISQLSLRARITGSRSVKAPQLIPALILLCTSTALALIITFLFIWFLFGCYWIFRVWHRVQYVDANEKTYCYSVLYRFAYWILIISFIYKTSTCFLISGKLAGEVHDLKKRRGAASTI